KAPFYFSYGFGVMPHCHEAFGQYLSRARIFWISLDSQARLFFSTMEVPIEEGFGPRQYCPCLGQVRIDLQSLLGGGPCLGYSIIRGNMTVNSEWHITFGKSCGGQSVGWISFNGFPEILDCPLETFCRSLAPVESSLQIQMIGRSVFGVSLRQAVLFLRRQLQTKFFGNFLRDVFFNRKDV